VNLDDVDEQLMLVGKVKTCPEREKYVCILMDEMHIKSDLVYDKHSGELTMGPACPWIIWWCCRCHDRIHQHWDSQFASGSL
jgi:hypothetical protein